jgi:hypothetical protein
MIESLADIVQQFHREISGDVLALPQYGDDGT